MAPQEALANARDGIADLQNRMASCEVIGSRKYYDRQTSTAAWYRLRTRTWSRRGRGTGFSVFKGHNWWYHSGVWLGGFWSRTRQKCRESTLTLASRVPSIFTCVLLDSQEGAGRLGAYDSRNHSGIGVRRPFLFWSFELLVAPCETPIS